MNEIPINPVFSKTFIYKIGFFCSSPLGNDLYYLKEFVDIMVNVIGEETVIEMLKNDSSSNKKINIRLGNEWYKPGGMKKSLLDLDKIIEATKKSYDILEDKNLKDFKKLNYGNFLRKASKLPMIKQDLYSLFVFLVNSTSIKKMSIPTEALKILESRSFKPVGEFDKRRVGDPARRPPRPEGGEGGMR